MGNALRLKCPPKKIAIVHYNSRECGVHFIVLGFDHMKKKYSKLSHLSKVIPNFLNFRYTLKSDLLAVFLFKSGYIYLQILQFSLPMSTENNLYVFKNTFSTLATKQFG